MKALIIGDARSRHSDAISNNQIYPFFDNRKQLKREIGLEFKHIQAISFADIESAFQTESADIFFIRPSWRESTDEAKRVMQKLRQKQPEAKIIFIDPFDQISSTFFEILPYVDHFLKYQRLKDSSQYKQSLKGGTVITDFMVRELGYDLNGWEITSEIPEGYEHRIETGWFITLGQKFKRSLVKKPMPWERAKKDIDVTCHVLYASKSNIEWYALHRMAAIDQLRSLSGQYKLAISGEFVENRTVSTRQYINDSRRSRIMVSPFGWGELTWRDYEAVCFGCLLVKPAVEHIEVEPNIFIPGKTYVPVRWDFSDLQEKCDYYLQNPQEANLIIDNARRAYRAYFEQSRFVHKIATLLQPASSPQPANTVALP
jgi:hypothetical protein